MKKAVVLSLVAASLLTGCAKRQIDVDQTGSVLVPGTNSLYRFCDGGVAVYWTKGRNTGEEDDYEFLVYDHPDCVGAGGSAPRVEDVPEDDE